MVVEACKETMDSERLSVNIKKRKIVIISEKAKKFWKEGKERCRQ